ncbi:MAG: DUF3667 domain-containing protein [Bacteroidota bacterium]|jgi:hypothetical protein
MSANLHIREQKNCLNCGAEVLGKYCSECGQLNRVPQMEIKDLFHDSLHAILHFDGKFFNTIKLLIRYPGELTKEYLAGKRFKYLPPIQLYLFTSAIFFFFLYTFFIESPTLDQTLSNKESNKYVKDSIRLDFDNTIEGYTSIESYEKKQQALKQVERDGKLKQYIIKQGIRLNKKFKEDPKKFFLELIDYFIHSFSSIFFISLPLIALWLNLIFYRKKSINIVGHFIFIIHNYTFDYVAIFIKLIFDAIGSIRGLALVENLSPLLLLWIFYYGYKSTKNFYALSRKKAMVMFSLAIAGSFIIFTILFLIYFIISLIKIQ